MPLKDDQVGKSIDFNNTEQAYRHLTKQQLYRAYLLFKMIRFETLTNLGTGVLKGFMKVGLPIKWAVKPTVFKHFVGGESIEDCEPLIRSQTAQNVKTILDLSVEGQKHESSFEQALVLLKQAIDRAAGQTADLPFAVFKPSALGHMSIVKNKQEKLGLTDREEEAYDRFVKRCVDLCEYAASKKVPIMVDAEETWVQDVYDEIVLNIQKSLNKEYAYVYNTYQLYRVDKLEDLKSKIEMARTEGFQLGVKIVRGAYMEKEREYAEEKSIRCLIQSSKHASDHDFNEAINVCLENLDVVSVVIGSHNEKSAEIAVEKLGKISPKELKDKVTFSQLYGMADHISYNLAAASFNVAKYVPYGPVTDVLPYLFRRAEENSSVQGQSSRELELLEKEMQRRRQS